MMQFHNIFPNYRLFSYGTLLNQKVQEEVFGRIVLAEKAFLPGFDVSYIVIDRVKYPLAVSNSDAFIPGGLLELSLEELEKADLYEGSTYKRSHICLPNGEDVWIYLKADC